ncbi:hypothetical protein QAD02_020661 [Eretmocerus hayati]|uniref:Uncharacterized protein n=1 Tax=Eretmocerus hayati TaxID=131215 RepID=A0ACC2PPA3_9HYME|nr:hypothetical protein QAD02_020661 [Eretmocerus hayati]
MAPQNAPVQLARKGLPENETEVSLTLSLLARWERRPKIRCAAARKSAPIRLISEQVIVFINTIESVEGPASDTKELEQEEENNDNEKDAMVDESVENDSVEAESVQVEFVYRMKPTKPQLPQLYAVKPTTALGAPPVDEERQRLES